MNYHLKNTADFNEKPSALDGMIAKMERAKNGV